MRIEKPDVHPLAAAALKQLADEGIAVSHENAIWLQHLATKTAPIAGRESVLDWLDAPVRLGGLDLWPLSIAAEFWLDECAYPWFQRSNFYTTLAEVFAMAFGRDPAVLRSACDHKTTKRMLRAMAGEITCSWRALSENMARLNLSPRTVEVETTAQKASEPLAIKWGDVVAMLCKEFGGTPEDWLFKRSAQQVRDIFDAHCTVLAGKTRDQSVSDAAARALLAFKLAVEEIRHGRC